MLQRRVKGVLAVTGVAAVAAALLAWPGTAPDAVARPQPAPAAAAPAPAAPAGRALLRRLDLRPDPARPGRLDLAGRRTEPFRMVGLTWTDPRDAPRGTVQVRTRAAATGVWSPWRTLEADDNRGPERAADRRGVRGATTPLWVRRSDGVAARVVAASGTARRLPAGLRLELVDPDAPAPAAPAAAPATAAPATAGAVPLPAYRTRAAWGADESIVRGTPSYGREVRVVFVHHTDSPPAGQDYSCTESPSYLRAIQTYHVRSNGWNDIGYNFVVDKCGTLFEGRRGGATQPVVGAHTYGFNTDSTGVAVIGNHQGTPVPAATRATLAQLTASVLGRYGHAPTSTGQLVSGVADGRFPQGTTVTFRRVSGHRDGVATVCPGDALYAQLPAVAAEAGTTPYGLAAAAPTGGTAAGGRYHVRTAVTLNWSITTPSALLNRFELLVGDAVAVTAPGGARSAAVPLAPGVHQVRIRAVHRGGGTATTPATTVVADVTKPTFPAPVALSLRGGTASTTAVPVQVSWRAADDTGLAAVTATAPTAATFGTTATGWATSVRPGAATPATVAARDLAGNGATSSVTRTVVLAAETAAARSGRWTTSTNGSHLNGKALYTNARGAALSWSFTGRAVGLVVTRGSTSGRVDVQVDGRKVATVDLRSGSSSFRQVIWTRSLSSGRHTVRVVNTATDGRPGVTVDGFVVVQ